MKIFRGWVLVLFCTCSAVFADTPINAWNNPTSGNWEDLKWSLGSRPGPGQTIMLTNQGWKAIAIGSATASSFPQSLNVDSVIVSGYTDSFNVLLLNYAGTAVPLRATNGLYIGAGGQVQNLYSSLMVDNGSLTVSNSQFIQVGGAVVTTNAWLRVDNGTYNLTNGLLQAGQVSLGLQNPASFVQDGGSASMTGLRIGQPGFPSGGGSSFYDLVSGWLYVSGALTLGAYQGYGVFNQYGGTNFAGALQMVPYNGSSDYNLYGGTLCATSALLQADVSATFTQTGGEAFITNTLTIQGQNTHANSAWTAYYQLFGGTLSVGSVDINGNDGHSVYTQSNGTARVAGNLYLDGRSHPGNLNLAGGTLACSNIYYSGSGDWITQTGGALIVSNLLSFGGTYTPFGYPSGSPPTYTFTGGTLSASNMEFFAQWTIGSSAQAGRISNPGWFKLGFTTLHIGDADEHPGRFILATNAIDAYAPTVFTNSFIALDGTSSKLSFANSSAETWTPGARLVINNWNGNPSGGGAEQLKFGTSATGLTASQLAQIQFSNPSGFPSGNYPAQLLSTGELVPASGSGPSPGLVNNWTNPASGNWEDLKWSLGILPASSQTIMITNQGWKAVAIGANTTQNFPQSLNVSNIFLGGYTDSFNVLLLNYAGFAVPLTAGSINVGSNSAMTILASAVNVTNTGNSRLEVGGTVNQGDFPAVNTSVLSLGNIGPGIYNLTNGNLTVVTGYVVGGTFTAQFNQYGGYHSVSTLSITGPNQSAGQVGRGEYDLYGGALGGAVELHQGGLMKQSGGTFVGSVWFDGTYELDGGLFTSPNLDVPTTDNGYTLGYPGGEVLQTGGTNETGPIYLGGVGTGDMLHTSPVSGAYVLSNGLLVATSTFLDVGGTVTQTGGTFTNSGQLALGANFLHPSNLEFFCGQYGLQGGFLAENSFVNSGYFTQSGGTNQVAGPTQLTSIDTQGMGDRQAQYNLSGGLFTTTAVTVSNAFISQSGGSLITGNLGLFDNIAPSGYRSVSGYILSGGQLTVSGVQVGGYAVFRHQGGTLLEPGLLTLAGGVWDEQTSGQQFGPLQISSAYNLSNSIISLPINSCVLHFADSHGVAWTSGVTLAITNWAGSTQGGGQHQIIFGSNGSALTAAQLSEVFFANPAGFPGGTYQARILSTGELVPASGPTLQSSRIGSALVLTWPGNYQLLSSTNVTGPYAAVPGASSPWTNHFTKPREFFMLRSP